MSRDLVELADKKTPPENESSCFVVSPLFHNQQNIKEEEKVEESELSQIMGVREENESNFLNDLSIQKKEEDSIDVTEIEINTVIMLEDEVPDPVKQNNLFSNKKQQLNLNVIEHDYHFSKKLNLKIKDVSFIEPPE